MRVEDVLGLRINYWESVNIALDEWEALDATAGDLSEGLLKDG